MRAARAWRAAHLEHLGQLVHARAHLRERAEHARHIQLAVPRPARDAPPPRRRLQRNERGLRICVLPVNDSQMVLHFHGPHPAFWSGCGFTSDLLPGIIPGELAKHESTSLA